MAKEHQYKNNFQVLQTRLKNKGHKIVNPQIY